MFVSWQGMLSPMTRKGMCIYCTDCDRMMYLCMYVIGIHELGTHARVGPHAAHLPSSPLSFSFRKKKTRKETMSDRIVIPPSMLNTQPHDDE